jgi:biopolymer transport protein ExbB
MKTSFRTLILASVLLALTQSLPVHAADASASPAQAMATLDQLLAKVRADHEQEKALNAQREAEFLRDRDKQQQLLDQARAAFNQAQNKNAPTKAQADANEAEINRLRAELQKSVGSMGDVYSVYRQYATDFATVLDESQIGAQHPGRNAELKKINNPDTLPSIDDMERLWYLVQEEMTESGQVTTYPGKVVAAAGDSRDASITRIGNFVAYSGDEFLRYVPETQEFVAPNKQPESRFRRMAKNFAGSSGDIEPAPIDPTRGNLLGMLARTPNLFERIHQGGIVGYMTIAVGLLGLIITFTRTAYLLAVRKAVLAQIRNIQSPNPNNPLGRIMISAQAATVKDEETIQYTLDEAVLKEIPRLETGHSVIKLFAAIGPMLGLLGTVTGMIKTFETISLFGGGDPKLMAGGISEALICTVLGLMVAVPLLFGHNTVTALAKSIIQRLDEQSAGILARALDASGKTLSTPGTVR